MELQRARRRRDELGHEPLCDRIRRRVLGKSDPNARGRHVTADRPRVHPDRRRRFGDRALQHVAQDEGSEVRTTQRIAADEVAEPRGKKPAGVDRVPDGDRRLAVELADPKERRDLRGRKPARILEAGDEPLHDHVVGNDRARAFARHRADRRERRRKRAPKTVEVRDLNEDFVEQLRPRGVVERGQRARDVGLADGDWCLFPRFVHGPNMMLGASSCARRIRPMPEQRVAEHLRRLPLFSRLPESELAELAERVRTKSFKRGEMIFRKDDPGTHLYMVLEGGVKIALPGEFGQEALVAIMRPGEFFGELALFDRSPRSASATALEDTRAALLAGDDFLAYLESHPASFRVVLETLARTIRRLSDRVEDLIFLDVPSRVAKYLLDLVRSSGDGTNELTLTQDELAAFIGASRVSVNRVLGDLERREIIAIRRRRIAIKDPEKLAKEIRV